MVATRTRWRRGFTLVELLVVIAILSLLLSLLAPTLSRAKDQVRVTVCISNTGQFSKAMSMYCDHNRGRFWLFNHISGYYWYDNLIPYHNIHEIRFCPRVDKTSTGGWGAVDTNWRRNPYTGSYGMNLWLTPNDPASGSGSYYSQFLQTDPVTGQSFETFFWRTHATTAPDTPTVTDSPWVGHWPLETDPPPRSYWYGTSVHVSAVRSCEFMGRVMIDRHDFAVSNGFCDGSARRVPLPELFLLKWARYFQPTVRTDIVRPQ